MAYESSSRFVKVKRKNPPEQRLLEPRTKRGDIGLWKTISIEIYITIACFRAKVCEIDKGLAEAPNNAAISAPKSWSTTRLSRAPCEDWSKLLLNVDQRIDLYPTSVENFQA